MVNVKFQFLVVNCIFNPSCKLSVLAAVVDHTTCLILLAHQDSEQHSLFNLINDKMCPPILLAPSHKLACAASE